MDLKPLLRRFPSVRLGAPADGERILKFYDRSALSGKSIRLRSVRSPDFFRLLGFQSDRYTVLLDEDEAGEIRGMATFTHRKGYLRGQEREITYLGDFRLSFDRKAMRVWRDFYSAYLETRTEPTITCVIDENSSAQNALVNQRRSSFRYELLAPYTMVNVLSQAPWSRLRQPLWDREIAPRRAEAADLPRLREFLDSQARRRAFGYCYSNELDRRLASWDSLDATRFFLLERREGSVAGCFALWSPSSAKSNVIERIPFRYRFLGPFARVPRAGEALKTMYLTHLEIDRALAPEERRRLFALLFEHMATEHWDPSWHMVSFCDFPSSGFASAIAGSFLLQTVPMKLFSVRHEGSPQLDLAPEELAEPGFEIALV